MVLKNAFVRFVDVTQVPRQQRQLMVDKELHIKRITKPYVVRNVTNIRRIEICHFEPVRVSDSVLVFMHPSTFSLVFDVELLIFIVRLHSVVRNPNAC